MTDRPVKTLAERLRQDGSLDPETLLPVYDLPYLTAAADRIDRLEGVLSAIAHCDTEGHPDAEPAGLWRSHMITMAKLALEG